MRNGANQCGVQQVGCALRRLAGLEEMTDVFSRRRQAMDNLEVLTVEQVADLVQTESVDGHEGDQGRRVRGITARAEPGWMACPRSRRRRMVGRAQQSTQDRARSTALALTPAARRDRPAEHVVGGGKDRALSTDADSQPPPRPDTPRGIEPRLRRDAHDGWVWRFRGPLEGPLSGRRLVEEVDSIADALDFQAYLRLAKRRGVLSELTRGQVSLSEFFETSIGPRRRVATLRSTRARATGPCGTCISSHASGT